MKPCISPFTRTAASREIASLICASRRCCKRPCAGAPVAGAIMLATLAPAGSAFFAAHAAGATVHWHGPWIFAVIATVALFMLNPVISLVEGCGQVRQVAGMRFTQSRRYLDSVERPRLASWAAGRTPAR